MCGSGYAGQTVRIPMYHDVRSHLILPPNPPKRGEGEFKPRLVIPSTKLTKLSTSNVYGVFLKQQIEFVFLIDSSITCPKCGTCTTTLYS